MSELPKYPREIIAFGREKFFLAVEEALEVADRISNKDGSINAPLLKPGFSRFILRFIGTIKGRPANPFANIPQIDVPVLKTKTDYCLDLILSAKGKIGGTGTLLCETVTINMSPFQGKTPAAVLAERRDNAVMLQKLMERLWQNIQNPQYAKFVEANKKQYDAIREAIDLMAQGTLTQESAQSKPGVIYDEQNKYSPSIIKNGLNHTYKLRMTCDPGHPYPFTVYMENAYAPLIKRNNKTIIDYTRRTEQIDHYITMTDMEFASMINEMYQTSRNYESLIFPEQHRKARWYAQQRKKQAADAVGNVNATEFFPEQEYYTG